MRIAIAQINTTVGALRSNRRRLEEAFAEAMNKGAELVLSPELALPGYPPRDLLEREAFLDAAERELAQLALCTAGGGALLVGTVQRAPRGPSGKTVHNSAVLLADGGIVAQVHKSLLPTYDVFDEARYFRPADPIEVVPMDWRGFRLGVTICEDAWNDSDFWPDQLYDFDPAQHLVDQGVDLLLNLSASPFHLGKQGLRRQMLSTLSTGSGVPVVQCNLVGGNDDLVFDGASFCAWPDGEIRQACTSFAEEIRVFDTAEPGTPEPRPERDCPEEAAVHAITLGVRDYFRKTGFSKAVVGLSGGIDSALTAALAVRALGADSVTGITMPSRYSSEGSVDDSLALADSLGIPCHVVPIAPAYEAYLSILGDAWEAGGAGRSTEGITDQNIQARIRGNILMAWSNRFGALVLSTGNKSELAVGYCTLYGDMAGGLAVISDLPKTFVYRVARWLNRSEECIPRASIDKPPSAELAPDQLDTDSLPPYSLLDAVLQGYLEEGLSLEQLVAQGVADRPTAQRIVMLVDRNEYKRRQAAQGIRVTSKAFGPGRRFPIAARFEHHEVAGPDSDSEA